MKECLSACPEEKNLLKPEISIQKSGIEITKKIPFTDLTTGAHFCYKEVCRKLEHFIKTHRKLQTLPIINLPKNKTFINKPGGIKEKWNNLKKILENKDETMDNPRFSKSIIDLCKRHTCFANSYNKNIEFTTPKKVNKFKIQSFSSKNVNVEYYKEKQPNFVMQNETQDNKIDKLLNIRLFKEKIEKHENISCFDSPINKKKIFKTENLSKSISIQNLINSSFKINLLTAINKNEYLVQNCKSLADKLFCITLRRTIRNHNLQKKVKISQTKK